MGITRTHTKPINQICTTPTSFLIDGLFELVEWIHFKISFRGCINRSLVFVDENESVEL